jgi:TonB-linked SusC/RagA family outer membrane protein
MSKKLLSPMRKLLPILALFSFVFLAEALPAHAQTGQILGTVTDSTTGEALPGVNVVITGTQQGASTNAQGQFTISNLEPGSYALTASFIGYDEKMISGVEVSEGETTQVNIQLVPGTVQLEEVVAVGYGSQRAEEVTSSISNVSSGEFIEGTARDAGELIENQIAGLNISQSSGDPRAGSNISLRGITTIQASSSPLVLIDGVPGSLETVSSQDIESIDVLKGGSAAAIYGSRASNGVILITTKSPEGDQPTRLTYSADVSTDRINNQPDFYSADQIRSLKEQYSEEFPGLPIASLQDFQQNTDWQEQVLRNPVSWTQRLALSGGEAGTNYRASLEYERSNGIILRSDNEDVIGRVSVDHSMFDGELEANANFTGRLENSWNGFSTNIWRQALTRNPTDRIRAEDGSWQERPANNYANPLGLINETNGRDDQRELRLDGTLTWSPFSSLELSFLGAGTKYISYSHSSTTFDHVNTTKSGLNGTASQSTISNEELLLEFTGTYQNEIGNHDFDILGGYSWQENIDQSNFVSNQDFPTDQFRSFNLSIGQGLTEGRASMFSGKQSWKLIGFFGRFNYNYDSRYLLTGSLRYEGNSKFGADNKWGYFPSVSAGWRIAQESFMQDVSFVDALKLRAGFGVTGIAPEDPYQSLASFQYGGSFFNNGEWVPGLEPARNANPNLRWERKEEINIGLDFTLFNQRLGGNVEVYRRTTEDLLFDYDVPVPPFLFPTITANVGELRNEGIEVSLNYDILQTENINWSTNANFSTNRNELMTLSNDRFQTENSYFDTGYIGGPIQQATHRIKVGGPVGNFHGYKSVGVNEDGIWQIKDKEGNTIPWTDKAEEDKQTLGNGVPNYRISWNHSVRIGDFDARVSMGGEFDYQILNVTRVFYDTPGNNAQNWLNTAFDKVDGQIVRNREAYVSHMIENGDYWKIESVTVGYSFGSLVDVLSNGRVYVTGRNLATITGYSGIDPEVNTSGLTPGVDDRFKFPTTRTYTVGVDLTF